MDGFYGDDQGGGLPNIPNANTFALNTSSWYAPTPQLLPPNRFVLNQVHQNSKNHLETFVPSNAFGGCSPSLGMDQTLGVDNIFLDSGRCSTLNIDFTNQVINPSTMIADSGISTTRNFTKSFWTSEEDSKLSALVSAFGTKNWATISDFMDGRAGKQCRERWNNNLRPDIKSDVWTEEEERILIEAHEKKGNKWSQIAKLLPGRTENAIKNHWNAATRKKTMRLNRYKKHETDNVKPQSTLLRDYVRRISSITKKSTTSITNDNNNNNNVTTRELTTILPDELPTSVSTDSPTYEEDFSFMQNLSTTSTEHMVQEPHSQTNMINPQGLTEDSFDMHLNNSYETTTQLFSDVDFFSSCPVSEPATSLNSNEHVYSFGDLWT